MIQDYFKETITGIEQVLAQNPEGPTARKKYALEIARLGKQLYSDENTIAWCGIVVPFDILHTMGVTSCFVEFVGAVLANLGGVEPALEAAEQNGYSTDICSYHRAVNGAAAMGLVPPPDFLIGTNCPCSGSLSTVEHLAYKFNKPLFVLHVPPKHDAQSIAYLAKQIERMVGFVEAQTGKALDLQALRQTIDKVNQTRDMLLEVYQLASHMPTPARRKDMINLGFLMLLLMGSDAGLDLATAYRDEFKTKIARKQSGIEDEQIRLLWFQNRIQFKTDLEEVLEKEYQTAVVVDELNSITWEPIDPEAPFEGFAARILSNPVSSPISNRLSNLIRMAKAYQVDGVIHPGHWGCRQGTGARGLVESALKAEGLPMLNLDVDCADPRNFSEGQLRTRVGAFIETIAARKSR